MACNRTLKSPACDGHLPSALSFLTSSHTHPHSLLGGSAAQEEDRGAIWAVALQEAGRRHRSPRDFPLSSPSLTGLSLELTLCCCSNLVPSASRHIPRAPRCPPVPLSRAGWGAPCCHRKSAATQLPGPCQGNSVPKPQHQGPALTPPQQEPGFPLPAPVTKPVSCLLLSPAHKKGQIVEGWVPRVLRGVADWVGQAPPPSRAI